MSEASLQGFVYAEYLEGSQPRSLGFRLLAPSVASGERPWAAEVEAFARKLQATPYPEYWPPVELFCSVLLSTGERLIGLARYGLEDQTPSHRRGGLELVGVVAPPGLEVTPQVALAIDQWNRIRRSRAAAPAALAGEFNLVEVLAEAPTPPVFQEAVPLLPMRWGSEGALLFAAGQPGEPDQRLGMLRTLAASPNWQWLPLAGGDFPFGELARRGPLVAWTPHLHGIALRLEAAGPGPAGTTPEPSGGSRWTQRLMLAALLALAGFNGLIFWELRRSQREASPTVTPLVSLPQNPEPLAGPHALPAVEGEADRVGRELHRYLSEQGVLREVRDSVLAAHYERLSRGSEFFTCQSLEAQRAWGAVVELTSRKSPAQIESLIRGLNHPAKGFDPDVLGLIAQRVAQRLSE